MGAPGSKKVKNWMIDRKIDPALRNSIPLILNSAGEIVWIPGFPPAESHHIYGGEKMVIHLTYGSTPTL
jgi:tRNA(Ile)-lysidine synthase